MTYLDTITLNDDADITKVNENFETTDSMLKQNANNIENEVNRATERETTLNTAINQANTAITQLRAGKQDVLTAGDNITIEDNVISAVGGGGGDSLCVNILYDDLKDLRDNGNLVPGQQYRITDYTLVVDSDITIGSVTRTVYRSAGHQFDIIVTADSESVLNENARAALHDGDTYFADCDLSAWKLKYTIDNDKSRIQNISANGKGLIYYMEDESGNAFPYDFKNIQFRRYKVTANSDIYHTNQYVGQYVGLYSYYEDYKWPNTCTFDDNDYIWCYTASYVDSSYTTVQDTTVEPSRLFIDNRVEAKWNWYQNFNDIVFIQVEGQNQSNQGNRFNNFTTSCITSIGTFVRNTFDGLGYFTSLTNFISNSFGEQASSLTFGTSNSNISFLNSCAHNYFGDNIHNISFGNACSYNVLKDNCNRISIGDNSNSNQFETSVVICSFENGCSSNIVGVSSYDIHLGDENTGNTFGSNNYRIDFSQRCHTNTLGNSCENIMLSSNCNNNTFNANVKGINVVIGKTNTTFTTAQNNSVVTS